MCVSTSDLDPECTFSGVILQILGTAGILLFSLRSGIALSVPGGNVSSCCGLPDWNFVDLLQILLDFSYFLAGIIKSC